MHVSLIVSNVLIIIGMYIYEKVIADLTHITIKEIVDGNTQAKAALDSFKIAAVMWLVGTVMSFLAVGLFVTKYWLMTKKVFLIMHEQVDKNLERKAQLIFALITLLAVIIIVADTVLIVKLSYL